MEEVDSCNFPYVKIGKKVYERIIHYYDHGKRCHDCNIINGKIHHFGCDMERCPKCGDQFAFCDCEKELLEKLK
jgi:hypothetical protein